MKYLISIDDTDTKETRGTGYHARQMAATIEDAGLGVVLGFSQQFNQNFDNKTINIIHEKFNSTIITHTHYDGFAGNNNRFIRFVRKR